MMSDSERATITLKRTFGRHCTQMGKSSIPEDLRHQTSRRDLWTELFLPDEEPGPHVKPVLQAHASHGDLTGTPGLLPSEVLTGWSSLPLDLLQETLQEHAVVVHHGDVVQVVRLPASDAPEGLVNTLDILLLARKYYR